MSRKNHRRVTGRVQASKNRTPAPPQSFPQTIKKDCPTGLDSYGYGVARALTRKGGTIVECTKCDWYHVVD